MILRCVKSYKTWLIVDSFKPTLCVFDKPRINFFWVIFSHEGLTPTPKKIKPLLQAQQLQLVAEVHSFLGLANFSSNFSTITVPLQNLTKKNATFQWDKEAEKLFSMITQSLKTQLIMTYFDPHRSCWWIQENWSWQHSDVIWSDRGQTMPCKPTMPQEQRYSQIEIESARVEFGVTQNHIHLYSLPKFSIWTDHKPLILIYMTYKTDPLARILIYKNITRISKWYRKDIQGYHYEMIYEVKQMLRTIQMDSGTTFMPTYLVQSQAKSISSLYNAYTQNTQP